MKTEERSMASNRKALFDIISGLKDGKVSTEEAELTIKACHEITDTFRVEIKGCEVAGELQSKGIGYTDAVVALN